jgi:hypothetical protein
MQDRLNMGRLFRFSIGKLPDFAMPGQTGC